MIAASRSQIGAIHAIAAKAGLDDDTRRDVIERETGKRSAAELTLVEAGRVIEHLKGLAPAATAKGAVRLDGPYAGKLRALWISAWLLGVVRERADKALLAFVERQTGLSHTRWLREPVEGAKAIEGLKKWIAREAGVEWPSGRKADIGDVKLAVIAAQHRRLAELGQPAQPALNHDALDDEMQVLGRRLRQVMKQGAIP
jgi:phage gp16-like protein